MPMIVLNARFTQKDQNIDLINLEWTIVVYFQLSDFFILCANWFGYFHFMCKLFSTYVLMTMLKALKTRRDIFNLYYN